MGSQRVGHDWATELNWNPVLDFSGCTSGREPACQCRRCRFNPWVWKIPWRRAQQPTPVFLPGKFHGAIKSRTRLSTHTLRSWVEPSVALRKPEGGVQMREETTFCEASNCIMFLCLRHTQIHITPCQSTTELLVGLYFQFYSLSLPFTYSSSLLSPFPSSSVIKADFAHKGKKLTRLSHRWCTASCHQGLRPGTGCTLWGSRSGTGLPDRISSPGFSDSGHRPWWSPVESSHFCVLLPRVHSSASWKERGKKSLTKEEQSYLYLRDVFTGETIWKDQGVPFKWLSKIHTFFLQNQ